MCAERRLICLQRGLTLVELIVFIVVVSIGLAGILGVMNFTNSNSANPMLVKQQIAIAESLLEEIEGKAFTWCDPDDPAVTTASGVAGCATVQGLTPTAGESRYSQLVPFDNVGDYNGFPMNAGIRSPIDSSVRIAGLENYTANVAITNPTANPFNGVVNTDVLQISVTVTAPGAPAAPPFTLTGYRFRYAPNSP